jgi:hypothetical protein
MLTPDDDPSKWTQEERQAYFDKHGYWATRFVSRPNSGRKRTSKPAKKRRLADEEKWHPYLTEGYPCPMRYRGVAVLRVYGCRPKQELVQEHPCLYRPGICRHITCASKAHLDGYACPCPAGDVIYAPATALLKWGEMFYEHPCTLLDGELARLLSPMCHHRWCAVEAHRNGYQCQTMG